MITSTTLNGRVHSQTIEFHEPLPCGDGQRVRVLLLPDTAVLPAERLPPGEGLRRAFGILSQEEGDDLDRFIEASRWDSCHDRGSEQT